MKRAVETGHVRTCIAVEGCPQIRSDFHVFHRPRRVSSITASSAGRWPIQTTSWTLRGGRGDTTRLNTQRLEGFILLLSLVDVSIYQVVKLSHMLCGVTLSGNVNSEIEIVDLMKKQITNIISIDKNPRIWINNVLTIATSLSEREMNMQKSSMNQVFKSERFCRARFLVTFNFLQYLKSQCGRNRSANRELQLAP